MQSEVLAILRGEVRTRRTIWCSMPQHLAGRARRQRVCAGRTAKRRTGSVRDRARQDRERHRPSGRVRRRRDRRGRGRALKSFLCRAGSSLASQRLPHDVEAARRGIAPTPMSRVVTRQWTCKCAKIRAAWKSERSPREWASHLETSTLWRIQFTVFRARNITGPRWLRSVDNPWT